jgi:hypothetical protein
MTKPYIIDVVWRQHQKRDAMSREQFDAACAQLIPIIQRNARQTQDAAKRRTKRLAHATGL